MIDFLIDFFGGLKVGLVILLPMVILGFMALWVVLYIHYYVPGFW
jgi:hypothetical protein